MCINKKTYKQSKYEENLHFKKIINNKESPAPPAETNGNMVSIEVHHAAKNAWMIESDAILLRLNDTDEDIDLMKHSIIRAQTFRGFVQKH